MSAAATGQRCPVLIETVPCNEQHCAGTSGESPLCLMSEWQCSDIADQTGISAYAPRVDFRCTCSADCGMQRRDHIFMFMKSSEHCRQPEGYQGLTI